MSAFADSSALVKLYAEEDGSELVRSESALIVSVLARVEVPAALWRKHRAGELAEDDARALVDEFEVDFLGQEAQAPRFALVVVSSALLDDAAALVAAHGLRAYDGVQLAAAIMASEVDPELRTFACFDAGLRRAAATAGLHLLPPAE